MQLDQVTAEIRPRTPYEAADLGVALARRHYFALAACWCLSFLPIAAVTIAILHAHPLWAGFVLWWLKPLFEHAPIHYLSRSLFSTPPTWRELIRAQPGLLRRGLRWITWERINLSRCLIMPVRLLEERRRKTIQTTQQTAGSTWWRRGHRHHGVVSCF